MANPVLVIMAAGMGSRYGGLKQMDPVSDKDEIIIDFSLYDAVMAGFKKVILGHLSKENNYPQLAWETVRMEVTMGENPYKGSDFPMVVAKRDEVSELVRI